MKLYCVQQIRQKVKKKGSFKNTILVLRCLNKCKAKCSATVSLKLSGMKYFYGIHASIYITKDSLAALV